jgi:hypothetical protein
MPEWTDAAIASEKFTLKHPFEDESVNILFFFFSPPACSSYFLLLLL